MRPRPLGQGRGLDAAQNLYRPGAVAIADLAPEPDHGEFATDYSCERRLRFRHHLMEAGTYQSNPLSELAPIAASVRLAQDSDRASGRRKVAGERAQHRGLAGSVCA